MNKTENNPAAPGLVGCLADSQADTQPAKRKKLSKKAGKHIWYRKFCNNLKEVSHEKYLQKLISKVFYLSS